MNAARKIVKRIVFASSLLLLFLFNNCEFTGLSSSQPLDSASLSNQDSGNNTVSPPNNTSNSGGTSTNTTTPPSWITPISSGTVGSNAAIGKYPGYKYNLVSPRPFISLKALDYTKAAVTGTKSYPYNKTAAQRLKALTDPIVIDVLNNGATSFGEYSAVDLIYIYYTYKDFSAYSKNEPTAADYLKAAVKVTDIQITNEFDLVSKKIPPGIQYNQSLYEGPNIHSLSLTYDYGFDLLTADQKEKWSAYAEQTLSQHWSGILSSWSTTEKKYILGTGQFTNCWFWKASWTSTNTPYSGGSNSCVEIGSGGSGWGIDNPGNNYFYSFVTSTLSWALASRNTKWFDFSQNYIFPLLVEYYSAYNGGGTREGTSYGVSLKALFSTYNIWRDSTGEDLSQFNNHAKETIRYWIHATSPDFLKYSPWGDQPMYPDPFLYDYNRHLMIEAVNLNSSTIEGRYGTWWLNTLNLGQGVGVMGTRSNSKYDLLVNPNLIPLSPTDSNNPLNKFYYSEINGILSARSAWSTTASWFLTIAGIMDESHAHEEQGSFIFYKQGWVTTASNIFCNLCGSTSDKNLVRFIDSTGATKQQFGGLYNSDFNHQIKDANGNYYKRKIPTMTYQDSGDNLDVQIMISGEVYHNPDAWLSLRETPDVVNYWNRQFKYTRSTHTLKIYDKCELINNGQAIFQLHFATEPVINGNVVTSNNLTATFNLLNTTEPIKINKVYMPTVSSAYTGGYKIEIKLPSCEIVSELQIK